MHARQTILLGFLLTAPITAQDIHVGKPKVFDHRTLTLMLEELNGQLARTTALDQAKIAAASGALQGMELRESGIAGTLGLARPVRSTTVDGTKTTTSEKFPDLSYPDSGIGTAGSLPTGTPVFGMAAQDLLGDQVNLQYQIFNLRMIIDRSLTDRLDGEASKLQAVLGIPISLDPSRQALDSAAVVKVTVCMEEREQPVSNEFPCGRPLNQAQSQKPVSVVALMPQEKTYNSATLSKSSKAFGGSAIAKVVQVGFSATKRGQTYFLYRDNDTVSFEDVGGNNEAVFGWQFRPVLGRRSVAPGLRQMFAVLALPKSDQGPNPAFLRVKVETKWVRYQRSQLTTYRDALWFERFGRVIGKPPFPPPQPSNSPDFRCVEVPTTESYQARLGPRVRHVGYTAVGPKNVVIAVEGQGFLSDTKVIMGGKVFDTSNGLKIKSERSFDLTVSSADLSDAMIQSRYGNAVPLIRASGPAIPTPTPALVSERGGACAVPRMSEANEATRPHQDMRPIVIEEIEWTPAIGGASIASVVLGRKGGLSLAALPTFGPNQAGPPLTPLVTLSGIPLGAVSLREERERIRAEFSVPAELAKKSEGRLTFFYPFLGPEWSASQELRDRNQVYTASRVKGGVPKDWTFLLVTDAQSLFDQTPGLEVLVPPATLVKLEENGKGNCRTFEATQTGSALCWHDRSLATLRIKGADVTSGLLIGRNGRFARLSVAEEKKEEPAKKLEIQQFDSVWFPLDRTFDKVVSVKADGQELERRKNGEKTDVLITRKLSDKPGTVDLIVYGPPQDGKPDAGTLVRIAIVCRECQEKENR